MEGVGGVLTVPHGQDSGVWDQDVFLTLKKDVQFRGLTESVDWDSCTPSALLECESCKYGNCLHRPSASETAVAHDQEWFAWYLRDKNCLRCKKG